MPPEHVCADGHAPTRGHPLAALWRTRSYLRPYPGRLVVMPVAACAAVARAERIAEDGPPSLLLASHGRHVALHAGWRASLTGP